MGGKIEIIVNGDDFEAEIENVTPEMQISIALEFMCITLKSNYESHLLKPLSNQIISHLQEQFKGY